MTKAFTNIYELASDRELVTPEICTQNDFYGHATILKNYIGWQNDIPLPFAIEHGAFENDFVWDADIYSPVPAVLCIPTRRVSVLKSRTEKIVESIGPLIQYASCLLSDEQLTREKECLGKNLLVFPVHSTHHITANYDYKHFLNEIKSIAHSFDSIRVCLYWKDILQGVGRHYEQAGFECVTAGHIYDPLFIPRLKSLLTLSDATMSNCNGTHIGFSILMNKPHYLIKQTVELSAETNEILERDGEILCDQDELLYATFSKFSEYISSEQIKYADDYWGIGIQKSKAEIVQILNNIFKNDNDKYANIRDSEEYFYGYYLPSFKKKRMICSEQKVYYEIENGKVQTTSGSYASEEVTMLQSIFSHSNYFYGNVILSPDTLASIAKAPETWSEILSFHKKLATDDYVKYVDAYYREAIRRFGKHWKYLDISNVLFAASRTLQPKTYLEIGVRRGRSACMVVRGCPSVNIVAFDMWTQNYAGMDNPGENFVHQELKEHGHTGDIYFINGNSHQTVPDFFSQYSSTCLDMITVDGDHSEEGAFDDLCNVIPHLSVGGVLVFDDISHPAHPGLLNVWCKVMARFPFLDGYEYTDAGFGVAFAIRKG